MSAQQVTASDYNAALAWCTESKGKKEPESFRLTSEDGEALDQKTYHKIPIRVEEDRNQSALYLKCGRRILLLGCAAKKVRFDARQAQAK